MYDRILVPIDGSEAAKNAIPYALDVAETYDAALYTLSVVGTSGGGDGEKRTSMYEKFGPESKQQVEALLDRASEKGIRTTAGSIAEGKPHRAILRYADEWDIDLIVMGTHGRGGIRYPLRRSVTEKVLRRADVPVLTIRLDEAEE
ncbi:stress response protein [Haladaptatus sp. W1]|uniref:universal stress protein n=1 Tax=Haladaptatus sp. W1 TaxID=1897478 RepID=UPI000849B658|nr:universal stress protein [Haladaptatus sp. W1]ODR81630.1 stress response protein [Haladaptatus sp. W1]